MSREAELEREAERLRDALERIAVVLSDEHIQEVRTEARVSPHAYVVGEARALAAMALNGADLSALALLKSKAGR